MGAAGGPRAKECKSYSELRAKSPTLGDGMYTLFPFGEDGEYSRVHCKTEDNKNWQAVWQQFGGPQHSQYGSGQQSNATLSSSYASYDGDIAPYEVSGIMASRVAKANYEYWLDKTSVTWQRFVRTINSGDSSTNSIIKINLECDANLAWKDMFVPGNISGRWGQMPGYVTLYRNGTSQGSTRLLNGWSATSNNIGFAQANSGDDPANGESVINGSYGRHAISYVHTSTGYNTTRCLPTCWAGTETLATENVWYVTND
tara:strand:- start:129 stop:902 length:774 start_codon:yes stop_codon:yes gene_type:complete